MSTAGVTLNRLWTRFATTDGTGVVAGGNESAAIDLSTPDDYFIEAQAGEYLVVARAIILIQDTAFDADKYGTVVLNAAEGVNIVLEQDGVEVEDLSGGVPISTIGEWAGQCQDLNTHAGFAAGDDIATARYTFAKHGDAIRLEPGDKLIFRCHGNFAALSKHRFLVEGIYESISE